MERLQKRIPLSTPTMHGEEMGFVREAFDRNWVAPLGFNVDAFETEMADYLSKELFDLHTVALVSGTAALHLAVKLAGVQRGDIVLCSDMTFAATVNPVVYEGGVPVFVDSEYETWNMNPDALELAFQKYPEARVVVLAHLYGTPSKIDEILAVCKKHGAILIEDAAESLSATYKGTETGTFGKYNVVSFNGNKIITSSGGGMLITRCPDAAKKALFWATQSREKAPWYQHEEIGYNYRMSNVVAGIGRGQLKHLEEHRALKEAIYHRYEEGFVGLPVTMNPYQKDVAKPNFWLSCLLIDEKCQVVWKQLYERLETLNIESRPIWKPMHMQPVYANNDFITEEMDVGAKVFARGLCLPSDIKMTRDEQSTVIEAIQGLLYEFS